MILNDVSDLWSRVERGGEELRAATGEGQVEVLYGMDTAGVETLSRAALIEPPASAATARPYIGAAAGVAKKLVRKAIAWYVNPLAHQESRFNQATVNVVERLARQIDRVEERTRQRLARERAEIAELRYRVEQIEARSVPGRESA